MPASEISRFDWPTARLMGDLRDITGRRTTIMQDLVQRKAHHVRFGVLAALIGCAFRFLPIEPLGFMLGFGVLVIAAVFGPFLGPDPHTDAKAQDGETAAGAE